MLCNGMLRLLYLFAWGFGLCGGALGPSGGGWCAQRQGEPLSLASFT